ncbi:hypothetical protein D3C73_1280660 [compost metagenome]
MDVGDQQNSEPVKFLRQCIQHYFLGNNPLSEGRYYHNGPQDDTCKNKDGRSGYPDGYHNSLSSGAPSMPHQTSEASSRTNITIRELTKILLRRMRSDG